FMLFGPLIIISFTLYLHIFYEAVSSRLKQTGKYSDEYVFTMNNMAARCVTVLIFYIMPSAVLFAFALRTLARPESELLLGISVAFFVFLLVLYIWRHTSSRNVWVFAGTNILLAIALATGLYIGGPDSDGWLGSLRSGLRDFLPLNLVKADLSERDLRGINVSGAEMREIQLSGAIMTDARLNSANITNGQLEKTDLRRSTFAHAKLHSAKLSFSSMRDAVFDAASMGEAELREANLRYAHFNDASLENADLRSSDIAHAKLISADLEGSNLSDTDITLATLWCARLARSDLTNALLVETKLNGAEFNEATLSGADLQSANVLAVNLEDIDPADYSFSESDLAAAVECRQCVRDEGNCVSASFEKANLVRTNLQEAKLNYADFSGADMHGANLEMADLTGANLSGAILSGSRLRNTDLSMARIDENTDFLLADLRRVKGINCESFRKAVNWRTAILDMSTCPDRPDRLPPLDFRNVDFRGVDPNLFQLVFAQPDMSRESFVGALMTGVDLRSLNLRDAFLRGAKLSGADLRETILEGVDFEDADISKAWLQG
ncbi:MAG: pentapeptide repeat-containing protein, partial [Rubricoccaceae bacterium]|nr:pentapeptide repeat-containing protein [Rubricoccaceae bacterium]